MALTNGLSAIGDAIREKTGGTDLIPFLDMPDAIRSISGGGTTAPNPLEYATKINYTYQDAVFEPNYELTLTLPNVIDLASAFYGAKNIKKIILKGNDNGNTVIFTSLVRNCIDVVTVDLTEYNAKFSSGNMTFYYASALTEILGELDFTECTTAQYMFQNCTNLETITPKANSIKISISFAQSSKLSTNSIKSIIDGLATVETVQTLTLNAEQKVLQSHIDSANAKGWTVAGGKVVQEAW